MRALFEFAQSEIIALPFFHETAFFKQICETRQLLAPNIYPNIESTLCRLIPGISLEHLHHMHDHIWFQTEPANESSLYRLLKRYARKYLNSNGAEAILNTTAASSAHDSDIWRWLVFALPPDLLLSAGWDASGPWQINTQNPLLHQHLQDHQVAQTHVHLGAVTDFNRHWCQVQNGLQEIKTSTALSAPGAPFDNGKDFLPYLTAGAICRLILGHFLSTYHQYHQPLNQYIDQHFLPKIIQSISSDAGWSLIDILWGLYTPETVNLPSYPRIQDVYNRLAGPSPKIRNPEQSWQLDPALRQTGYSGSGEHYEVHWQRQAFAYLDSTAGQKDQLFQVLFWQSIRLKVMYYRYIVQRPMVKGLSWFVRFYSRIKRLHRPKFALQQAFLFEGGHEHLLKSYEFRIGPDPCVNVLRNEIHGHLQSWLNIPTTQRGQTEVGCVIHIPKQRGPANQSTALPHHWQNTHLNPENNPKAYRLSEYFNQKQTEIQSLSRLLQEVPLSLAFIRGFDMCADETGIPNWFMAALFSPLKEAAQSAFQKVKQDYPEFPVKEARQTMHIGEDFHHLLDGLRRMDEVIMRFPLEQGDRIGHGLALGISPQRWAEQHPVIWMPRETRLWDLVWEWHQYTTGDLDIPSSRLEKIKALVKTYTREIFGPTCQPEDVHQLYDNLFNANQLFQVGFPNGEVRHAKFRSLTSDNRSAYWLYTYLTDSFCFQRCYEIIEVQNTADEVQALLRLQRLVRQRLCSRDITIEVNPSSNFLIADLQNLEHHPLWNLDPPPGHQTEQDMGAAIKICLGSDDPLTFATHLPQEYALLYNALLQKRGGGQAALNWLDKVRQNGLNARFTLSFGKDNKDADTVWKQLLHDLKRT